MHTHTPRPRLVARAATVALWAVGSSYLLRDELVSASPDWFAIAATPVVWAVVISLPILATYARHDRQWLAMALIWCAAIAGSVYTLQATLGRQAEGRDVRIERAQQANTKRVQLERELAANQAMLSAAVAKCGAGRRCLPATEATIKVYRAAVVGTKTELSRLPVSAPAAGEQRIAWLIATVSGHDLETVSEVVGIVAPALFGLVIELSAFALALYGWHPERRTRLPVTVSSVQPAPLPPRGRKPLPDNVVEFAKHPVIRALETAGRPVNNDELARLMGVTKGEASKRWREVSEHLQTARVGRELRIALRA